MSVKNNAIVVAAALAAGLGAIGAPLVESLVDNLVVTSATIVETDKTGHAVLFVEVPKDGGGTENRPVADSTGGARVYAGAANALSSVKRSAPSAQTSIVPFVAASTVGDPIKTLISKHKAAKTEATKAQAATTSVAGLISAADALDWDQAAAGSAEKVEWIDLQTRAASIAEWKNKVDALVTQYTASLVAANIDPVTYLSTGG